jgi:integrase/recombinase XerD
MIVVLAKTGIRRGELVGLDISDIDWEEQSLSVPDVAKRTNQLVFFDGETSRVLQRWLRTRERHEPETDALFTNLYGNRLQGHGVSHVVKQRAEAVGLHDPDATDLSERFTPHCCRHWFTTHLMRSGMKREFIQELRGDSRGDAIDIYDHIDEQELREAYLAHIPTLGL